MSQGNDKTKKTPIYKKLGSFGFYFIVMGVSLAVIYLLWASFGYIGPSFSSDILNKQQTQLRADFGIPYKPIVTNLKILETPPSLLDIIFKNNSTNASNSTNA